MEKLENQTSLVPHIPPRALPLCGLTSLIFFPYSPWIQTQGLAAEPQSLLSVQTSGFKMMVMPELRNVFTMTQYVLATNEASDFVLDNDLDLLILLPSPLSVCY